MTTWTFVLIYCFGCTTGVTIIIPNFESVIDCQQAGVRIATKLSQRFHMQSSQQGRLSTGEQGDIYECIPSTQKEK